ncbi:MAG: rhomboid family intramembrane serine protease [Prolixibacteraceae bacterium]|jgi:membrane associated rhomboid family serine protease|nr:rhomboid family intramembrane serine protease [Prolixibacteraceae bacterium]MBT6006801.1 rhomboid family intramembrane serine protease [Prolixibacteraceae bacterium]MBT6765789.1 rhomboid family intramembrane serine protease [Prolixibacteraceae bacterium]MBT6997202.1 rhomboid family intramembrane serine protease [Prolixibacteraceae bacterium]MBT7393749.1 rhomboid family intramembrane serine protease [Prolixibacteraceae bacterium]
MITWLIIGVTALISYLSFQNERLADKLQFNAAQIIHKKEYYRLISHAFIHANWPHLIVNMLVLYFFGRAIEGYLGYFFGNKANAYFLILYFGGILASNIWSLIKHQNNYYYNAVGASGAVSAVLFAFIFFDPLQPILLFAVLPIPGILFAIGYLLYSYQMSKRKNDNVAHDAHFLGALFGFVFPILLKPELFSLFIDKLFAFI